MKNCIVCVAVGRWHPAGAKRLLSSLGHVGYNGQIKIWANTYPPGCPTHQELPYAFKPHAFKWAFDQGYENVFWFDSAVWAQYDITDLFSHVKQHGYFVLRNGWTSGNWCTDQQLEAFGISREEAFGIPHPMACVVGINRNHPDGQKIFSDYWDYQHLFSGPWTNENKQVSQNPQVMGSRHDQAVLGLIMHRYNLEYTDPMGWIHYQDDTDNPSNKTSMLLSRGM